MAKPASSRRVYVFCENRIPDHEDLDYIARSGFTDIIFDFRPFYSGLSTDSINEDLFFTSRLAQSFGLKNHLMVGLDTLPIDARLDAAHPLWSKEIPTIAESLGVDAVFISINHQPEIGVERSTIPVIEKLFKNSNFSVISNGGISVALPILPETRVLLSSRSIGLVRFPSEIKPYQIPVELKKLYGIRAVKFVYGFHMVPHVWNEWPEIENVLREFNLQNSESPPDIAFLNFDQFRGDPTVRDFVSFLKGERDFPHRQMEQDSDFESSTVEDVVSTDDDSELSKHLSVGSSGPEVAALQHQLRKMKYRGRADGVFGPVTKMSVEAFQKDHGLVPDGIVGPKTLAALSALEDEQNPQIEEPPTPGRISPEQSSASAVPEITIARPGRAKISGDLRTEEDSLRIGATVNCFARLFAAEDVPPPISLGLFGNWGSGKTYFMSQLKQQIEALTDKGKGTYVGRVAHIEFNAWHYSDANLWANLAVRIFDGLANEIRKDDSSKTAYSDARTKLRKRLHSSREAMAEANTRKAYAEEQQQLLKEKLTQEQAERETKTREKRNAIWQRRLFSNQIVIDKAKTIASGLGLDGASDTIEKVTKLAADLALQKDKFAAGITAYIKKSIGVSVFLFGVGLMSAAILWFSINYLNSFLDTAILPFISWLAALLATVSPLIVQWKKKIFQITAIVTDLSKALAAVEVPITDETIPESEKLLLAEIERHDQNIREMSEKISVASMEITRTEKEIIRLESGSLVYDFLSERQENDSYQKQLGIIATIRRDFRQLGELLNGWNHQDDKIGEINYDKAVSDGVFEDLGGDTGQKLKSTSPIKRIVLYIDDLDRCHPDRVVEVLQAVHLLLALDLFMVVVAVDARWLERSLYKAYLPEAIHRPRLAINCTSTNKSVDGTCLNGAIDMVGEMKTAGFSPQNYLEKIFQIPYSLPKMSADGFGRLVDALTRPGKDSDRGKKSQETPPSVDTVDSRLLDTGKLDTPGESDKGGHAEVGTPTSGDKKTLPTAVFSEASNTTDTPNLDPPPPSNEVETAHSENRETKSTVTELPDVDDNAIHLTDPERHYMGLLHGFIDTPRLAKRMVNIYRILRVNIAQQLTNTDSPMQSVNFFDVEAQGFRAAMLLLAVNIGFPRVGGALIRRLESEAPPSDTFKELVQSFKIEASNQKDHEPISPPDSQLTDAAAQADVVAIYDSIEELSGKAGIVEPLPPYRILAPYIGQYSFRWHLDS